jgi:RES domain
MEDKDPCRREDNRTPPNNFNGLKLDRLLVTVEGYSYRLNDVRYPSALHFDTSGKGRFDGENQGYGILYTGADVYAAFIECFGRDPQQERNISEKLIRSRNLFKINSSKPLIFADLTSSGLNIIGASLDLIYGDPFIARKWAKSIFLHPQQVDGIRYRSRLDSSKFNYGIFDRAKDSLREESVGNLVDTHPYLLGEILDCYQYGLVESS